MNIYHRHSPPKVGVGDSGGGGSLNKDAQEVILQGYIQGSSINCCLKMAVGGKRVARGGGILVLKVARMVVQGCRGEPAPLDSSVTRLSGP